MIPTGIVKQSIKRCPDCGETRTITGRQARRIELGEEGANRRCQLCRSTARIRVTAEHRAWARTAWSGWTQTEQDAVAYAFRSPNGRHP